MKTILTNSCLTTFKTCPCKYEIQYVKGYVPAKDSDALYFGKLFHAGLEAWSTGADLKETIEEVRKLHDNSSEPNEFMFAKIQALLEGYVERYSKQPYTAIAVEKEFYSPLLNPETSRASNLFELGGKLDCLVKDELGRVFIMETKTTSDEIEDHAADYWRKLPLDSQVSTYYLGATALGYEVEGCVYDVIRKPELRPYKATPMDKRQYKKDGTLYASQRDTDETPEEYLFRLREAIAANPAKFYARKEVPRSSEDLANFLFDVWTISQTINTYAKKEKWPRYTNSCVNSYGMKCPYFDYCTGQVALEDELYFQKVEQVHRELNKPEKAA